jgi:rhodanese-related sulfurtransferase
MAEFRLQYSVGNKGRPCRIRHGGGDVMHASKGPYAGDLDAGDVWKALSEEPDAVLVDVRTATEWSTIGVPDLRSIGKEPVLIEWQTAPLMEVNPRFLDDLAAEFGRRGYRRDAPVYFLCRSGVRSLSAAMAATAGGFGPAYNVAGGFEGPPGPDGRRGTVDGWQALGLPWTRP